MMLETLGLARMTVSLCWRHVDAVKSYMFRIGLQYHID